MFPDVDPVLKPEMKSTGEVLGIAESFDLAFWKAQEAVVPLPKEGTVLITVSEQDRQKAADIAAEFTTLGFKLRATAGTRAYLMEKGIDSEPILKEYEGRPNITDAIKNREIQLVINTPSGKLSSHDDSYIRKAAIRYHVPYITTLAAATAAVKGIKAFRRTTPYVKSLQSYHRDIINTTEGE